jgi:hypothetical protein
VIFSGSCDSASLTMPSSFPAWVQLVLAALDLLLEGAAGGAGPHLAAAHVLRAPQDATGPETRRTMRITGFVPSLLSRIG